MTRAELLELLKKARKQLKKYHVPKDEQTVTLSIDTLENALSEQPQIVRCKDCIASNFGGLSYELWCGITGKRILPTDFCSNGRRKDSD